MSGELTLTRAMIDEALANLGGAVRRQRFDPVFVENLGSPLHSEAAKRLRAVGCRVVPEEAI